MDGIRHGYFRRILELPSATDKDLVSNRTSSTSWIAPGQAWLARATLSREPARRGRMPMPSGTDCVAELHACRLIRWSGLQRRQPLSPSCRLAFHEARHDAKIRLFKGRSLSRGDLLCFQSRPLAWLLAPLLCLPLLLALVQPSVVPRVVPRHEKSLQTFVLH